MVENTGNEIGLVNSWLITGKQLKHSAVLSQVCGIHGYYQMVSD